jgi:uncharacterized protein (DUF4213/DUF364 family)
MLRVQAAPWEDCKGSTRWRQSVAWRGNHFLDRQVQFMPMTTRLLESVRSSLPQAKLVRVAVGLFWTAVIVEQDGSRRCGLAATLNTSSGKSVDGPAVPSAGELEKLPAGELAAWATSPVALRRSLGMAAINAMLPHQPAA